MKSIFFLCVCVGGYRGGYIVHACVHQCQLPHPTTSLHRKAAGVDDADAGAGGGAEPVVHAMCLFPALSPYGRSHGYKTDFVHGVYKWDFSGLLPDTGSGTLEYRQVSRDGDSGI